MKIKVDLKIFFILILYLIIQKTEILILAVIFILLHEVGHIVSGITLGLKIKKIKITIAGISLEFANYGKERKIKKRNSEYTEGKELIGRLTQENERIPTIEEIVASIKTPEQAAQIRDWAKSLQKTKSNQQVIEKVKK